MKQYLYDLVQQVEALNTAQLAIHIIMAVLLGFVIYVSYYVAHAGTVYSRKFNVSLVVLTVLTSTVMTVIGNNIALSLGMVGALSIVRFRTAIKDSRDTVYIFSGSYTHQTLPAAWEISPWRVSARPQFL